MEPLHIVTAVIALAILIEATYLVVKLPRQNIGRKQSRPILVDTSVLIDGRILAVAQSGFIGDTLVIPRSVIGELQFLADNADHDKRARARHGLDVVKELQTMPTVTVEILQDGSKAEEGVDERLLNLAKKHSAAVCTIDFNLNKVAVVENIEVLNVNELAQSLRMAYLPGERMLLEMIQKGQDSHQAVGYLTDGTMVVVEQAYKHIGSTVEIEFIRSLQTAAGKMMFAKLSKSDEPAKSAKQTRATGKKPLADKVISKSRGRSSTPKAADATPEAQDQDQAPVVEPQPSKDAPAVYHSDDREQRRTATTKSTNSRGRGGRQQQRPRAQQESTQSASDDNAQQQPGDAAARPAAPKRHKTSSQREASLMDLVAKQSE